MNLPDRAACWSAAARSWLQRLLALLAGTRLELSKNEYRILQVLMQAGGAIVPRETLMQRLWESDSFVDENTLSVNVARLRKSWKGSA